MASDKRELKPAYVAGDADLRPFMDWPWPHADMAALIAARSAKPVDRDLLVRELMAQNSHLPSAEATLTNIRALADAATFTVTTGHQVCLLGGPMFTLYKIATTIAMARELGMRHPGHTFVPVLWMATEDHDWEEVNHFYAASDRKLTYSGKFQGPVGRHVLGEQIAAELPESLPQWLRDHYRAGNTMAEAFRSMMHHLFGAQGLVIVDADRPALKQAFVPHLLAEVEGNGIAQAVRASTQALEDLGFKAQIYPRDINLFYIGDGHRRLIDREDDGFRVREGEQRWNLAEIQAEIQANPAHFSPNVALRPLYQESLLPNLAYVGGWAEVSYWMQLRDGFRHRGVFYPMVVPRLHATIFTAAQAEEWKGLGFALPEVMEPLHVLNDRYLSQHWDEAPVSDAIADVDAAFDRLIALVEGLDPTLATGIKAEQARGNNAFDGMRKKLRKSMRNRNPQPYQRISALKQAIEPENLQQQRTLNFTAFDSIDPVTLAEIIVQQALWDQSTTQWITLP